MLCSALLLVLVALAHFTGCGGRKSRSTDVQDRLVTTPVLAVEALPAGTKTLYYNSLAWTYLSQKHPELLREQERQPGAERTASMIQAVQNPKLFRQLDRQNRFDAVLLVGDPSQYRPLLDHLLEATDWKLHYVDHTSIVYARQRAQAWSPAELSTLQQKLQGVSKTGQALAFSQLAVKLVALRQFSAAKEQVAAAQKADSALPEAWSADADYHMALGDFAVAISTADKALKLDPDCLPALGVKAQSLFATKKFDSAYAYSSRLVEKLPNDPGLLFYHAKIAHQSRHFQAEITALEKLIKMAVEGRRGDSGYYVYLGQAYASSGDAKAAISAFVHALADPELPEEQRKFTEDTITLIQSKVNGQPPPVLPE